MPPVPSNLSMTYPAKTSPLFNGMAASLQTGPVAYLTDRKAFPRVSGFWLRGDYAPVR